MDTPSEESIEDATQVNQNDEDISFGPPEGRCGRGPESCFWPGCAC